MPKLIMQIDLFAGNIIIPSNIVEAFLFTSNMSCRWHWILLSSRTACHVIDKYITLFLRLNQFVTFVLNIAFRQKVINK